eukprot:Clim_evm95s172 gene=Clim_evmTU95s172
MDVFRSAYDRACRDLGIDISKDVWERVTPPGNAETRKRSLNLSARTFSPSQVQALSLAVANDTYFTELNLADCLIGDDGAEFIAQALKSNTALRSLDLRGNNIRAAGGSAICQALKVNCNLMKLCLEWNSIGVWDSGIVSLAEMLTVNNVLKELDLRNCCIDQTGATSIATSLRHNSALRDLDMRWNNSGVVGGRALADAFQWNVTLCRMDLAGNHVPDDVIRIIEAGTRRNRDAEAGREKDARRTAFLNRELQTLEKNHRSAVDELKRSNDTLVTMERTAQEKMRTLQESLIERKDAFDKVHAKYLIADKSRTLLEERVRSLEKQLDNRATDAQKLLDMEREERIRMDEQMVGKERTRRGLESDLFAAKKDIEHLREELSNQRAREREQQKVWEARYREQESAHARGVERELASLRDQNESRLRGIEERLRQVEAARAAAETDNERLKAEIVSHKLAAQESQKRYDDRLADEEERQARMAEDRIRAIQVSKDEMQKRIDALVQESHVARLRANEKVEEAERTMRQAAVIRGTFDKQRDKLLKEKARMESAYQQDINNLNREVQELRDQNEEWERIVSHMRDEELRRIQGIEKAVTSYVSQARNNRPRSPARSPARNITIH